MAFGGVEMAIVVVGSVRPLFWRFSANNVPASMLRGPVELRVPVSVSCPGPALVRPIGVAPLFAIVDAIVRLEALY